ncbi:MAG: DMT family transporter [Bacillota bacterium]|jgi:quaternary ammonium compound-resistance protein SugE
MMWFVLFLASFCELGFTVFMKLSDGLKKKRYIVLTFASTFIGVYLLSLATKTLPLGVAYAVWTGLGTALTVTFGIFVFKESRSLKKLFFIAMILIGVLGLRLTT